MLPLIVAIVLSWGIAWGEDLTTPSGHTYKNITVTRVDPDGIHVNYDGGCGKIPFDQLPPEMQKKYGYNPSTAAAFAAAEAKREAQSDASQQQAVAAAKIQNAHLASVHRSQNQYGFTGPRSAIIPLLPDEIATIHQRIRVLQDEILFMQAQEKKVAHDSPGWSIGGYAGKISDDQDEITMLTAQLESGMH